MEISGNLNKTKKLIIFIKLFLKKEQITKSNFQSKFNNNSNIQ
jgi:hypothetical protein